MISDLIETALLAPWVSADGIAAPEWTLTPVAFDNLSFTPPSDGASPWVEVSANAGRSDASNVSLTSWVGTPTVTISANVSVGAGKSMARQILDAASALYLGRSFMAGNIRMTPYSVSALVETAGATGWYRLSTQISFKAI